MRRAPGLVTFALASLLLLQGCADRALDVTGSSSGGLVFARVVDDGVDLARVRLSDQEIRPLTKTPDRDEAWPSWSELARLLVFEAGPIDAATPADLWLWTPNTGKEDPLTQTPYRNERWAVWSPNQSRLAFAFVGGGASGSGIAVVDPRAGAGAQLFIRGKGSEFFLRPTFAPDGASLVAQRRGPGGGGSTLWRIDRSGTPNRITTDPAWFDFKAWFTRDGKRIVYSRRPAKGGWHQIVNVGADGQDARVILQHEAADFHSSRPSPVRDELVFVSNQTETETFDVYLADLDGKRVRNLSQTPERNEFAPRWSPDGSLIAVTVIEEEFGMPRLNSRESLARSRVVVLDRDGNLLLDIAGFMPAWMPPW
jgi:Tol biopolymer transport system component